MGNYVTKKSGNIHRLNVYVKFVSLYEPNYVRQTLGGKPKCLMTMVLQQSGKVWMTEKGLANGLALLAGWERDAACKHWCCCANCTPSCDMLIHHMTPWHLVMAPYHYLYRGHDPGVANSLTACTILFYHQHPVVLIYFYMFYVCYLSIW